MLNIAIDMMGGDYAPAEAVAGVERFLQEPGNSTLSLVGDVSVLEPLLQAKGIAGDRIKLVDAPERIGMHEHPTKALKEKPRSAINVGFGMLAAGKTDAFVSAGNTGAMLVGALFSIKALEGVIRPTISTIIPKNNGGTGLLLDVGLNADCKPEQLNQFAVMGSVYAKLMLGIENPRVGLINVGEEEGKGNMLAKAAYPLLKENKHIHFIGNVEGRDLLFDKADVMVCDGFTGNILLKLAESLYDLGQEKVPGDAFFGRFNFEIYGGTPVLGVDKPVIIGHGISGSLAFLNMIKVAERMLQSNLMDQMRAELA